VYKKRVVITGIGVISPLGIGKADFWSAVSAAKCGIKPVSLFETSSFKVKNAGEVSGFDASVFLGAKGLRTLDRSVKLICSAAKLALEDSGDIVTGENSGDFGVVIASTLGSLQSISDFDREALKEGSRYVNPALFPNTVINSPASQVSLKFNLKGLNATVSTGFSAGLDCLKYAADALCFERVKSVLAGAVEELCIQTFIGFYQTSLLDKICLGEGAAVLVLRGLDSVESEKEIYAEISGFGKADCAASSMRGAMEESGVTAADIDCIFTGAYPGTPQEGLEDKAINEIFGGNNTPALISLKPLTGECFSASGSLQAAAALGAIQKQVTLKNKPVVNSVLINSFGPCGSSSSMIVSRFRGEDEPER
jgi:3-oxoacyl-[acyl-carrier-protein] synthase II